MNDFFYRKLSVYQESLQQVKIIYELTRKFPVHEQYCLTDQIKRAVISIPSNIAEGMGRTSLKERIHFIDIANGSLAETMCQLEIANSLNYISDEELRVIEASFVNLSRMLAGFRKSIELKLKENNQKQNKNIGKE